MSLRDYFRTNKCWEVLTQFINVLRINIVIADQEGEIIIPPEERKFGGKFYLDSTLHANLIEKSPDFMNRFEGNGRFLESVNHYGLYSFALPIHIKLDGVQTVAYMIVGPVILNKRDDPVKYMQLAQEFGVNGRELINEINGIRVLSNMMANSVLDLLSETIQNNIALSHHYKIDKNKNLEKLLDVALNLTGAECGSIMLIDEKKKDMLSVRISKGPDHEKIQNAQIRMGEGLAGIVAQGNESFFIGPQESDNRIAHLLKRPEIKQAIVMPLLNKGQVFGVLNLHTTEERKSLKDNYLNLKQLTEHLITI